MVLALIWLAIARHLAASTISPDRIDLAIAAAIVLFWLGSRDALTKYHKRLDAVLATGR